MKPITPTDLQFGPGPSLDDRPDENEQRRQVAEGLRGILGVLNSNRSLDEILDYIVGQARRLLGADAAAIYRLHPENYLTIRSGQGLSADYIAHSVIQPGQLATGRAVLIRQPVALSNIGELVAEARLMKDFVQLQSLQGLAATFQAILSVPLVIKDEPVGALTLYYTLAREFSQEEIDLAVAFCDQSALAIENARLREEVKEEAITAERSRLARDLHDSVTQMLFSASLIAEVLPSVWNRSQVEGEQALQELRRLTHGALAEMRAMLLELRPDQLQNTRLEDLLRQLAESTTSRMHAPVTLEIAGLPDLPAPIRLGLYRIAQEALNNIMKHSSATQIQICLVTLPSDGDLADLELTIQDNGYGFIPQEVNGDHLGLTIMRERAASIGAQIDISSQPQQGTQVKVHWHPGKEKGGQNEW